MTSEFFRFPHTPHLLWLGSDRPRNDKVMSASEAESLLSQPVTVEEKIDGANVGFSLDESGEVKIQNRGAYLSRHSCHTQFKPLFHWLSLRRMSLQDRLPPKVILFGEWCYAVHSVSYTRLPDWFLAFDVYDLEGRVFWGMDRRDELLRDLNIAPVPHIAGGRFRIEDVPRLIGPSAVTDGPAEGIYLKWSAGGSSEGRAKVVRASFVQGIDEHWSEHQLVPNKLAPKV